MLHAETMLNERYRIEEPVGEGGMATVYRALDTRLGRTVALKVLHPEFARDHPFIERFDQEAQFAASLGAHPNIVAIYDVGQDGNTHYIVQELVEGRSLKDLIRERAPFTVPEAFSIGQQVASALDFAHRRGLVHRDVKPQNILVTPEGRVKVTDFGIARSMSASQMTRTGVVIGTVHYFSPEQAQGLPAEPASDVYSLGIIMYEMLTGHLPFDADNPVGVAMQHVHSEPPSPWDFNPDLPTRAVATVMRALEKDPARRYRDAAGFAAAMGEQVPAEAGSTTLFSPIPPAARQETATYHPVQRTVQPAPVRTRVQTTREPVRERRSVVPVAEEAPPNPWRTTLLVLGGLLLLAAIVAASFFVARSAFGPGGPTATPTATRTPKPTPTATPKPKRRTPTPTPSVPIVVLPTSPPPLPTDTPRPLPTATPFRPTPTPTPMPPPTVTPEPPTVELPTPTPTPFG